MSSIPTNLDALLSRERAADALREAGYPVAKSTLATLAVRGGGPAFRKFGPRVLYRWGDLLDWVRGKMSTPRRSSSEADTQPPAAA